MWARRCGRYGPRWAIRLRCSGAFSPSHLVLLAEPLYNSHVTVRVSCVCQVSVPPEPANLQI